MEMDLFPKSPEPTDPTPAPIPLIPSARYSASEAFAPPTDVKQAWLERKKMIRAILNAGMGTLRDRAIKYVETREEEKFMRNAQERKPQPPLRFEDLLDVFNS